MADALDSLRLMRTQERPEQVFVRGQGSWLWDSDGRAFLDLAARVRLQVTTVPYPLARADEALADLAAGRFAGAAVLVP